MLICDELSLIHPGSALSVQCFCSIGVARPILVRMSRRNLVFSVPQICSARQANLRREDNGPWTFPYVNLYQPSIQMLRNDRHGMFPSVSSLAT